MVCFDETTTQLLAETRAPLQARPGRPRREDYEYVRAGTCNLFLTCGPKDRWRRVAITQKRTMQDFAHRMRWLMDEAYPDVPVIRLVMENLNTHRMASLYETFPAPEARRIAKRQELHHTPKHGSWLNPVLNLPKGWRRSSSACWPGPARGAQCRRGQPGKGRERLRVRAQCYRSYLRLALHSQGRPNQAPPPLPLPF